jgi:hypothetical protein
MKPCLRKKRKKITKRTGSVAQGVGPEFKPQYCKKKKKKGYNLEWHSIVV